MSDDKIIKKLIEHDEKLAEMVTKVDFEKRMDKVMDILEDMASRVKRIDEDRVFSYQWIKRIEQRMEEQDKDIKMIKAKLQMA